MLMKAEEIIVTKNIEEKLIKLNCPVRKGISIPIK